MSRLRELYDNEITKKMTEKFGYKNPMMVPKIDKIVINMGVGEAVNDKKNIEFKINYVSPLGSFATWKSTKQTGSYDLRTFEVHALPVRKVEGLRPGMSVLVELTMDN